jgi:FdhD protein
MIERAREGVASSDVRRLSPAGSETRADWVAVEAPLEVRIGGRAATVLMRTPGSDEELVRGFLFTEGIIGSNADVLSFARPAGLAAPLEGNVMAVELRAGAAGATIDRSFYSNASCGVCGKKSIESLDVKGRVSTSDFRVAADVVRALPDRLRAAQPTFASTGGVHASALFAVDGTLLAVREDVGRHNALDKLIGWALGEGRVPLRDVGLMVSGRVSYEIVQKAVVASIPLIAAVGAPSSLAVELAERFGVGLVGFVRPETMNVYACPERIA